MARGRMELQTGRPTKLNRGPGIRCTRTPKVNGTTHVGGPFGGERTRGSELAETNVTPKKNGYQRRLHIGR